VISRVRPGDVSTFVATDRPKIARPANVRIFGRTWTAASDGHSLVATTSDDPIVDKPMSRMFAAVCPRPENTDYAGRLNEPPPALRSLPARWDAHLSIGPKGVSLTAGDDNGTVFAGGSIRWQHGLDMPFDFGIDVKYLIRAYDFLGALAPCVRLGASATDPIIVYTGVAYPGPMDRFAIVMPVRL